MYQKFGKRSLDFLLSMIGLVILAVPMLLIALLIKLDDPGPAFFTQKRVGRNRTYFQLYKFRSMKVSTPDVPTHLLENPEQYILRVGGILRKTSLDELPQLVNILLGQMSIVGPRPALWNQDDLISLREQHGVNDVRPGLTGWAQINGRDELTIEEKVAYDREYVQNFSFWFDCKCFLGTIGKVLRRDGVVEGASRK